MRRSLVVRAGGRRLKGALNGLIGTEPSFKRLQVYPDDVFIVSYPRSGNTWVRFLVGNLVWSDPVTFGNLERRVPDIYMATAKALRQAPRPRYLKSHECFDPRYPKVIYIVRDPRDVLVSYYHYQIRVRAIPGGYPMVDFAARFMEGGVSRSFGSWKDHVSSWLASRGDGADLLLLRYEDLLEQPVDQTRRISAFLGGGKGNSNDFALRAVELSAFSRMRKSERKHDRTWPGAQGVRSDKPFVRAGEHGQWKRVMQGAVLCELEWRFGDWMEKLGYCSDACS